MADTLSMKLKKQKQVLAGMSDPSIPQDPNQPSQGMGDMRVAEQQSLADNAANQPEGEFTPAAPATNEDQNKPLQVEEVQDPSKLANRIRQSDATLNQLQDLATQYEKNRIVPQDRTQSLKDSIAEARALYNSEATKNDWLQVAQTLSRAVAQFGAAASGGKSHNMAGLDLGNGIDYEARSKRALDQYKLEREGLTEEAKNQRQKEEDLGSRQKEIHGIQAKSLEDALAAQREREKDEDQFNKAIELAKMQGDREALRNALHDKKVGDAEAEKDRILQINNMKAEQKSTDAQVQAGLQLANLYNNYDDMKSKYKDKLPEMESQLAAKAGIDPAQLTEVSNSAMDKGILGTGIFRSEDKKAKSKLVTDQLIKPKQDRLGSLKSAIDELSRKRSSASAAPAASNPAPAPQDSGMVKMKSPSGQVGEIPAARVKDAESKGFVRI